MLKALGCIGLGLAWGWLLGLLDAPGAWSLRTRVACVLATLALAAEAQWLADGYALALFLGAAGAAMAAHLKWRNGLRARFGRDRLREVAPERE